MHELYAFKEEFRAIYTCKTRKEAEDVFYWWRTGVEAKETEYPQFANVVATVENWYEEIFNYFDYRYTNATTKSINNLIKSIAKAGRGYDFPVIRAKMLYKTKATKKTVILGSSSPTRPYTGTTMSVMTSYGLATTYKHGWGVDIDELAEILKQTQ